MKCIQKKLILIVLMVVFFAGCSKNQPVDRSQVYRVAMNQLPPEPVYNRLGWALPPEPIPNDPFISTSVPLIMPKYQVSVQNMTLKQAADHLGRLLGYKSYCSSTLEEKRVSFSTVGNADELADAISEKAGISAIIDHQIKEVRFTELTGKGPEEPRLFEER